MKKPFCVFTLAHNENVFLPIWLKYYSKYFEPQDILVVEHNTTDGSIEEAQKKFKFNVAHVKTEAVYDHSFMLNTVVKVQRDLLQRYNTVVYSDTDEFVVIDPKEGNLKDYLKSFKGPYIKCISRSVAHQEDEPNIDLSKPILSQRSTWYQEAGYDKTYITSIPLNHSKGLHKSTPLDKSKKYRTASAKKPFLIHLARMDYELRKQRGANIQKENWGGEGLDGVQQLLRDEQLRHWFFELPRLQEQITGKKWITEKIPTRFKNVL